MDPPVSVPNARGASKAATAAAEPPPEPPGTRKVSQGLRVIPKAECSVDDPCANSSRLVLPKTGMPAFLSRSTTVASYGGTQPCRILEAAVVSIPLVTIISFTATGTPASSPVSSPAARRLSASSAWRRASSSLTLRKAWISPSAAWITSRWASTSSRLDISPSASFFAICAAESRTRLLRSLVLKAIIFTVLPVSQPVSEVQQTYRFPWRAHLTGLLPGSAVPPAHQGAYTLPMGRD